MYHLCCVVLGVFIVLEVTALSFPITSQLCQETVVQKLQKSVVFWLLIFTVNKETISH